MLLIKFGMLLGWVTLSNDNKQKWNEEINVAQMGG